MAVIHPGCSEHLLSELDIFRPPPVQLSIDSSRFHVVHPVASLDHNSPITFKVVNSLDYLDLSESFLILKLNIVQGNNDRIADPAPNAIPERAKVFPVNSIGTSLFKNVEVFLNSKLVSSSENLYPYRAYLENLLSYSDSVQERNLTASLWAKDTAGHFNSTVVDPEDDVVNLGAREKWLKSRYSRSFEVVTRIHTELFNCPRLLMNNIELTIRLTRADSSFCLMSAEHTANYNIIIEQASLYVCTKSVSPAVRDAHVFSLTKGNNNVILPVTRGIIRAFSKGPNRLVLSENSLYSGRTPRRVFVALVDSRGFAGHLSHNPFNFQNFGVRELILRKNGVPVSFEKMDLDFPNGNYPLAYTSLLQTCQYLHKNEDLCFNYAEFAHGYAVYGFNLSPDYSMGEQPLSQCTLSLDIMLTNALQHAVTVICYLEISNQIQIDSQHKIYTDY